MKKVLLLTAAAWMMVACSNETLRNDEMPGDESGLVTVTAELPVEGPASRVTLTEQTDSDAMTIKVAWETEESFTVFRGTERETYSKTTEGNRFSGTAHSTTTGTYYAFYPKITSGYSDYIAYDLASQTGALDSKKTYMYAVSEEGSEYSFNHLTALVKFTLTLPEGAVEGVVPTMIEVSSDKLIAKGTLNLTASPVEYSLYENDTVLTITPTAGELTFYAYVNPMEASETETNTIRVGMTGSDKSFYTGKIETKKTIEAGYLYTATVELALKTLGNVTDATKVETGDLAMVDGSFYSNAAFLALGKTEQEALKSKVSGVVFWTTKDTDLTDESRVTPAKLSDDKILAIEQPQCTHGLIVALYQSSSVYWQGRGNQAYSQISAVFQQGDNFQVKNKDQYSPIRFYASADPEDNAANYIRGYQNTKVLRAFNDYCKRIENTDSIVYLIPKLDEYAAQYPAPKNSSGWYILSIKELVMLYYKDTDDSYTYWNTSITVPTDGVKNTVYPLVEQLGGNVFGAYLWTSNEGKVNNQAVYVYPATGRIVESGKNGNQSIRPVCAF